MQLEELADELSETSEKFGASICEEFSHTFVTIWFASISVKAAEAWDAWNRPDPDLPRKLRNSNKKPENDPNFEEHLPGFLKKGLEERPDAELPSALRLLKYKSSVSVKRLAAAELRTSNEELAAEVRQRLMVVDWLNVALTRLIDLSTLRQLAFDCQHPADGRDCR